MLYQKNPDKATYSRLCFLCISKGTYATIHTSGETTVQSTQQSSLWRHWWQRNRQAARICQCMYDPCDAAITLPLRLQLLNGHYQSQWITINKSVSENMLIIWVRLQNIATYYCFNLSYFTTASRLSSH